MINFQEKSVDIVVGSALGDALGAGYEYGSAPLPVNSPCEMIGGGLGNFSPYEWTDDTSMGIPILQTAALHGENLNSDLALDDIAAGFLRWYSTNPPDIGGHTRSILSRANDLVEMGDIQAAQALTRTAQTHRRKSGISNGGLMRTNAAVLPYLRDEGPHRAMKAAIRIAALTHAEPESTVTSAVWVSLVWAAANGCDPHTAVGLTIDSIPEEIRYMGMELMEPILKEPNLQPRSYQPNGYATECFKAAFSAIYPIWLADPDRENADNFMLALDRAVKAGADTDTVACVAGGLAGAIWGINSVQRVWVEGLHGYPGLTVKDLIQLAAKAGG
jgi:ADP-ribosylglycohydrolase